MKVLGELRLVRASTDEQIPAMRSPLLAGTVKLPTIEDAVKAGGFLAGRPEDRNIGASLRLDARNESRHDPTLVHSTPLTTPLIRLPS
jgi:hypothetical protein